MFETPFTRRQMTEVVQKYLLPWAWRRESPNGEELPTASDKRFLWLQPPLQLPPDVQVVERIVEASQLRRGKPAPGRGSFASQVLWPELGLHTMPFAWLGFLYQGEIDLRIGANRSLIIGPEGEGKIHIVTLESPTLFVIPPGVPHPDGNHVPWERPLHLMREEPLIFWIHLSPSGLRCHLSRVVQNVYQEEFFVLLNNEALMGLARLFMAEMQRPQRFSLVVEATVLSLLLEINRCLLGGETLSAQETANDEEITQAKPDFSVAKASGTTQGHLGTEGHSIAESNLITIEAAKKFIEMHLNWKTLSPEMVAHQAFVSASQLNRLFKAYMGLTVKEYIQLNRIGVAKSLLEESDMAVSEVGFLCGFFPPSHFARAFSQATGITPKKFRDSRRRTDTPPHTA